MSMFYDTARMIFLFNVAIALLNGCGAFDTEAATGIDITEYDQEYLNGTIMPQLTPTAGLLETISASVGLIISALGLLGTVLINATIGFPWMLYGPPFNLPIDIVIPITAVVVFIYAAGLIEFARGSQSLGT